jgi:hypothetical protein
MDIVIICTVATIVTTTIIITIDIIAKIIMIATITLRTSKYIAMGTIVTVITITSITASATTTSVIGDPKRTIMLCTTVLILQAHTTTHLEIAPPLAILWSLPNPRTPLDWQRTTTSPTRRQ